MLNVNGLKYSSNIWPIGLVDFFFLAKSIFLLAYDLRSPGYSWGLHTFILVHTKQYYTLQHIYSEYIILDLLFLFCLSYFCVLSLTLPVSIEFCCDSVVIFYLFLLCYFEKLEKTYVGVKNGQSIDTGNVRLKTQK